MLLDLQSLVWGELPQTRPTLTHEFSVWDGCFGGHTLTLGASREFETWACDGALILDIDESGTGLVVVARRRVAMF